MEFAIIAIELMTPTSIYTLVGVYFFGENNKRGEGKWFISLLVLQEF